ncbi:MAG: glycosyltransferase family 2 protein [Gammaproteobacteria bacterium]|nr:glycosyltransferase family 2 protein [Gammaproteobacteria bacterium]
MEKVSVIIPCYNSSSYVTKAVESALNQTYGNLEVIVVDDASTDDTCDVVRKIADPRVTLIQRTENGSCGAARNSAIPLVTGRYIAFLDSDDCWLPDKISVQIKQMQDSSASFSCTNYIAVRLNRQMLVKMPEEINYQCLLKGNVIHVSTVVYDSMKLGKIYMPELRMAEDFATWLNLLKVCETALVIREPLAYCARRKDQLSARLVAIKYFTYKVYRETQGLSVVTSLYYLLRSLPKGLWKRLSRNYI